MSALEDGENEASATADASVLLTVTDLAKAYGSTRALRSCTLSLRAGEVHAVVGENGSGKSTMVKLVTGIAQPDRGLIEVGGVTRASFKGPEAALSAGVVAVFQNVMVIPERTVLENIWLGFDGVFRRGVDSETRYQRGADMIAELLGRAPDLNAEAGTLPLSDLQALSIARALLREPKILILDEATSALDVATRDRLFAILRRLAAAGTASIFISHRMDEIEEIGDVITVMRAGETIATLNRGETSTAEVVALMAGAEREAAERAAARRIQPSRSGQAAISARNVVLRDGTAPINLEIFPGELVGVAGLEGHGQERFLQVLAGSRPVSGEVVVGLGGTQRTVRSRRRGYSLGIGYVPRDRQTAGIFESLSINDNFAVATVSEDRHLWFLSRGRTRRRFAGYVESLKIKLADPSDPISTLSGGNQQKVVLARWLAANPRVLLLDDPTRGIDPGAKRDLYDLLSRLTTDGMAVVMVSTDIDELVELADRVVVFREGVVHTELGHESLTRNSLVASFFGR